MSELNFEQALQLLKEALNDDQRVQAFFAYQSALENDFEVQKLNRALIEAQKVLTLAFPSPSAHQKAKDDYNQAKTAYENHPLVANFMQIQIEIADLLAQIKTQLE